jgi:uncharacterized membrane protein SpoIIM required for sporulation
VTQDEFIAARQADWSELDVLLQRAQERGVRRLEAEQIARLAERYRALAGDIARAQGARFSGELVTSLERLAARAHSTLYAAPPWRLRALWELLATGFPRTLRRRAVFFAIAAVLFALPMLAGFIGAMVSPTFASRVLPPAALEQAAESYGQGFRAGRGDGEGAMMTGFYIYNNIGIAFRCFAAGIFFGLGSVFFLVYNGVVIGTMLGHVVSLGYGGNILSFVASHSPFELTAIVIAGGAGLQMGYALVQTDGEPRLASLRRQGPEIIRLVMGAAAMLLIAAFIEGLWSGSSLPLVVKLVAGAVLSVLVAAYLLLAGRERPVETGRGARA